MGPAVADGACVPRPHPSSSEGQVLFNCEWLNRQRWYDHLRAEGLPVAWPDEITDWGAVRFAVGWNFTPELIAKMPSLRVIASLGAGVDHAMRPGLVPPGVDIVRIVDPLMAQRMATWVIWAVITHQRKMDAYARAQAEHRWDKSIENMKPWDNGDVRVGIMGYGVMGQAAAALLQAAGHDVAAWARTPRPRDTAAAAAASAASASDAAVSGDGGGGGDGVGGVSSGIGGNGVTASAGGDADARVGSVRMYAGREELRAFVERSDILVCLLPLTPETQGIINAELLSWLPRRAAVVNAARGAHLDEGALLRALDEGRLGGAVLDVFAVEPLPPESRLWSHPAVRVTPHVSSSTDVPNAAAQIADNYRRLLAGRPLLNVVDKGAGY